MARQKGILRFIGKIGRTVYYYHKHFGYLSRRITSVNAARIHNDPAFARVRDNNTEFARGAWAVRLIRAAFLPLFKRLADTHMTGRLTSAVLTAMRSNTLQGPGKHRFENADLEVMQGFNFNLHSPLGNLRLPRHNTAVDYDKGTCTVSIPGLVPSLLAAPKGATHVRFTLGIALIDTATGQYALHTVAAPEVFLKEKTTMPLMITGDLPHRDASHVFMTLGVDFFQAVNGDLYELSTHNTLTLVYAATAPRRHKLLTAKRTIETVTPAMRPAVQKNHWRKSKRSGDLCLYRRQFITAVPRAAPA